MSEDITFCGYKDCPNKTCERHTSHIKNPHISHSYAYFPECEHFQNITEKKGDQNMKLYCENCDFVDSCGAKRKEFFSNPKAIYTVCYLKRISGNPVNYEPDSV